MQAGAEFEFAGTQRFEVRRRLGAGGFGVVFEAFDRERGTAVALKMLHAVDPGALYRFKQEFRALADVSHPNLVSLHELVSESGHWFFTMELIDGVTFLEHVRGPGLAEERTGRAELAVLETVRNVPKVDGAHAPASSAARAVGATGSPPPAGARARPATSAIDLARLRAALAQLAAGVTALHSVGLLHRDIKPSNVLVTRAGRVVLLDFGLATDLRARDANQTGASGTIVGTVAYMSPEQAAARPATEASDWYSVGVMLYEALTGTVPFRGKLVDVLHRKQHEDPPAPRTIGASVPPDLDALCLDLLARRPEARPRGPEVGRCVAEAGPAEAQEPARGATAGAPAIEPCGASSDLAELVTAPIALALSAPGPGPGSARPAGLAPAEVESGSGSAAISSATVRAVATALVGRERHLAVLAEAFEAAGRGSTVALHVHGRSGSGKSFLVRHFLDRLQDGGAAVVLHGRCYERESVPFKALDSLVDALSRHLARLAPLEAVALVPRDVAVLARLFPVLRGVQAVADAPRPGLDAHDAHEARRRASGALRDLLGRLAARRPLVLSIDDLQWGDLDSAALLLDLLGPPDPPPLLFIGAYRTEEATASPLLRVLLGAGPRSAAAAREVEVGALEPDEARALAHALLGGAGAGAGADAAVPSPDEAPLAALADTIARESRGNPFFVAELVRHVQEGAGLGGDSTGVTLERVIRGRVDRLPAPARRLLELACVAGRPISVEIAASAAGIGPDARSHVTALKASRLAQTRGAHEDRFEPFHDRIREAVVAELPARELEDRHRRLALAFEAVPGTDPETLAVHFLGAGDLARAGVFASAAAERAAEALAFDRAARLYRLALEALRPRAEDGALPGGDEARERAAGAAGGRTEQALRLRGRLGCALRDDGRGGEAADEFLAAAKDLEAAGLAAIPDGPSVLELRRLAAEQLLLCGRFDEGLAVMRTVLGAVGLKLASTPLRALVSLLFRTVLVRLRGLRFSERAAKDVPAADLARIDICWSAASALSHVDLMRAAELQARHMLLALRAGELARIGRALMLEVGYSSLGGGATRRRTERLVAASRAIADRLRHPEASGRAALVDGAFRYFIGEWRHSLELVTAADGHFREGCTGVAWEVETLRFYVLAALFYLGDWHDVSRRLPPILRDARERGDLYTEVYLRCQSAAVPLWIADAPEAALEELREALGRWRRQGFLTPHWWNLWCEVQTHLYAGDARRAWARISERFAAIRGAMLLRVQFLRVESLRLRAAAALAVARAEGGRAPDREALLASARQDAARIERERMPWSDALAHLLRAGLALADGDPAAACGELAAAEAGFEATDMVLHGAAARRQRGLLEGGDGGRALVDAADRKLRAQGIARPERVAAMLAAGC